MPIRVDTNGLLPPSASIERDLVRLTEAVTLERPPAGPGRGRRLLEVARLQCSKGGPVIDGVQCSHCRRFINATPAKNMDSLEVRCLWSADDPVHEIMTRAVAIVSITASMPLAAASELFRYSRVKQLVVVDTSGVLVGQIHRSQIADDGASDETVADRMSPQRLVLRPGSSIADAVDLFADTTDDCLPVVSEGELVGLVTRGDLIRVGVARELVNRADDSFARA